MRKLLLTLLLLTTTTFFAQELKIDANIKSQDNSWGQLDEEGVYEKEGKLIAVETSMNGFKGRKTLGKKLDKRVEEYVARTGVEIEFFNESFRGASPGVGPKLTRVYTILNAKMTKKMALAKIKELKEYLEVGLLTQEEYDAEVAKLKKALLQK